MTHPTEIEYPEAYEAAIKRNIRNNAYKTWRKTTERADEIEHWVNCNGGDGSNSFSDSLFNALLSYGKLTPKQCVAVLKCIDGCEERKAKWAAQREIENANAEPIVAGKQMITGTIISTKLTDGFAYNQTVLKMVIKDDRGFKLYGTVPQVIIDEAVQRPHSLGAQVWDYEVLRGQRVTFTATVEASKDDDKFGFFKRPIKAALAA